MFKIPKNVARIVKESSTMLEEFWDEPPEIQWRLTMMAADETGVKFLTLAQVAEAFGVSAGTIWNWVNAKKIKAKRFARGTKYGSWRVAISEVERVKARLAQGLPL